MITGFTSDQSQKPEGLWFCWLMKQQSKKNQSTLYLENYTQKYLITKVKKETRRLERHPGMCESTYRNRLIPKERRT